MMIFEGFQINMLNLCFFFESGHSARVFIYIEEQPPCEESENTKYWQLRQGYLRTSRMQLSLEGN